MCGTKSRPAAEALRLSVFAPFARGLEFFDQDEFAIAKI